MVPVSVVLPLSDVLCRRPCPAYLSPGGAGSSQASVEIARLNIAEPLLPIGQGLCWGSSQKAFVWLPADDSDDDDMPALEPKT